MNTTPLPIGWKCIRGEHNGPCALVPRWWNLKGMWQMRPRAWR